MDVYQQDISDILGKLPSIDPASFEGAEADLFICALGFEERATAVIQELARRRKLDRTTIVLIEYPSNLSENARNLLEFEHAAVNARGITRVQFSRKDYPKALSAVLDSHFQLVSTPRVSFDISACSSFLFYPTMRELLVRDVDLTIFYSESEEYYPTLDEWKVVADQAEAEGSLFAEAFENASFQTLGVEDVYSPAIFSEMNPGNRPTILMAVPNFSAMRMNAIITRDLELNKTAAENVYWLIGVPPEERNQWRSEAVVKTNNLRGVREANILHVSTLDYKEMLKTLEDVWLRSRHSHHATIGSLGSKMQHLGTFLFLYLHKDVGLWVAEPQKFRFDRYSSGVGPQWCARLGRTANLRGTLDRYMTFTWRLGTAQEPTAQEPTAVS